MSQITSPTPIATIQELQEHLQAAVALELSTIPVYLYAAWSIRRDAGDCKDALMGVALDEMCHMTIVANCLIATGRWPDIKAATPQYPTYLPDGEDEFVVGLLPFSRLCLEQGKKIESPDGKDLSERTRALVAAGKPLPRAHPKEILAMGTAYPTIGDFYRHIKDLIVALVGALGQDVVFPYRNDTSRQVTYSMWDVLVTDGKRALELLDDVIEEGEGASGTVWNEEGSLAHYFVFDEMSRGRRYKKDDQPHDPQGASFAIPSGDDVFPMPSTPRKKDYEPTSSAAYQHASQFNDSYAVMLGDLAQAFNGDPGKIESAIDDMRYLKALADHLKKDPIPDEPDLVAGPTFEAR